MKKITLIFSLLMVIQVGQAHSETITLSHETNWIPHYGQSLPEGGYTVSIIQAAMKQVGYQLDPKWMPWKRAQEQAKLGKYDGLGASYCTAERQEFFSCSNPIAAEEVVFYKRKSDNISYQTMEDLKPYSIGVGIGYGYPKIFADASYLNKVPVKTLETNITKLGNNRIDIIVGSKRSIVYHINKLFPESKDKFEQLGEPLSVSELYVLFSKNTKNFKEKTDDFNRGLATIKENGDYEKIMEKFGF